MSLPEKKTRFYKTGKFKKTVLAIAVSAVVITAKNYFEIEIDPEKVNTALSFLVELF